MCNISIVLSRARFAEAAGYAIHQVHTGSLCRQQSMQRAHELKEAGTLIDLYPMTPPDETFDMTFWSKVLEQPDADPWEDGNNVERLQASPKSQSALHHHPFGCVAPGVNCSVRTLLPLDHPGLPEASISSFFNTFIVMGFAGYAPPNVSLSRLLMCYTHPSALNVSWAAAACSPGSGQPASF